MVMHMMLAGALCMLGDKQPLSCSKRWAAVANALPAASLPARPEPLTRPAANRHPTATPSNDDAGEVSQDRGQGGNSLQVHDLPTSGGGGAPPAVRGHCGADQPAAVGMCLGVMDKSVCMSSQCVCGALCGSISADEQGRSVGCGGVGRDERVAVTLLWGETPCTLTFGG